MKVNVKILKEVQKKIHNSSRIVSISRTLTLKTVMVKFAKAIC